MYKSCVRILFQSDNSEIARAYLVPEATVAQRIVRANRTCRVFWMGATRLDEMTAAIKSGFTMNLR